MIHRLPWLLPLGMLAVTFWWWSGMRQEAHALREELAALHGRRPESIGPAPGTETPLPSLAPPPDNNQALLTATLRDIAAEREHLAQTKREAEALAARIPAESGDEIIASYGTIENFGREAGNTLREFVDMFATYLSTQKQPNTDFDQAAETATFTRFMRLQGQLPEIKAFEDHPDEIASFQSNVLQQVMDLKPEAVATSKDLIRATFAELGARHLTGNERPAKNAADWKQQRTEVLRHLMQQLRPLLPDQGNTEREKFALMLVLNLGAGFEQTYQSGGPGKPSMMAWGMKWPTVPW